MPVIVNC